MQPQPGLAPYGYAPRTNAPRTIGILSIIFGSIVTCTSLFGVFGQQLGAAMQPNRMGREAFEQFSAEVHGWSVGLALVMMAMSLALLFIGIGQRGYKRWAVRASVTWGVIALLVLVAQAIIQFSVMMPAMEHMMDALPHGDMPMGPIMKVSALLGIAFYAPYPIVLIVCFRKPGIVSSMDK